MTGIESELEQSRETENIRRESEDAKKLEQPRYPVAEIFESIQGEGAQMGMAQTFIRLAGCTVGKPYTPDARKALGLKSYQECCTSWDGTGFPCDTNYRIAKRMTVDEIVNTTEVSRALWVSITGGEPLMHNLEPLIDALDGEGISIHLETSGTITLNGELRFNRSIMGSRFHVAVSPKQHCLESMLEIADEIRVMVDKDFSEENLLKVFAKYLNSGKLWISPVNDLVSLNYANLQTCIALQHKYRQLRLTTQMHKTWGLR
jgi:7-carboxy-7-deazaguanine synthase